MYIYQPDRILLQEQINNVSKYISGKVLDVGAGESNRYGSYFNSDKYIRMDVVDRKDVDIVGRADNIPLKDESIDSIICTQVFEHLDTPFESAAELFRVVKKGGHVLVTVPQMNELHEEPHDYFRYTNFGMHTVFEKAGFTVVKEDQRGGVYAVIAQILIRYWIDNYQLHNRKILGRFFGKFINLFGRFMMVLDRHTKNDAAKKHTIGWCFVFKKEV